MEENLNQNISQTIPSPIEPAAVTPIPSINQPPFGSWWKVGGLVLGAVILAGGLFFAGYQYSQKQVKPTPPPTIFPTSAPISSPQTITTPTPDETANWKTYISKNYNFTFRYPSTWDINEFPFEIPLNKVGDSAPLFNIAPKGQQVTPLGGGRIYFFIHKTDNAIPLLNWVKENGYQHEFLPDSYYKPPEVESITISNREAIRINYLETPELHKSLESKIPEGFLLPVGYKGYFVYIKNNDLILELTTGISDKNKDSSLFDQILSTLKLID